VEPASVNVDFLAVSELLKRRCVHDIGVVDSVDRWFFSSADNFPIYVVKKIPKMRNPAPFYVN
jgi:hypothetical protein